MLTCDESDTPTTSIHGHHPMNSTETATATKTIDRDNGAYLSIAMTELPAAFDIHELPMIDTSIYSKESQNALADPIADSNSTSSSSSSNFFGKPSQEIIHTSSAASSIASRATRNANYNSLFVFRYNESTNFFEHAFDPITMTTSTITDPATTVSQKKNALEAPAVTAAEATAIATHATTMSFLNNDNSSGTATRITSTTSNRESGNSSGTNRDSHGVSPSMLFSQFQQHASSAMTSIANQPQQQLFFDTHSMPAATTTTTDTNSLEASDKGCGNGKKRARYLSDTNESLITAASTTTTTSSQQQEQQQNKKKAGSMTSSSKKANNTKGQPLDPEDEAKRKNFLERNRIAALKCRQRKKQWLQNLQQKVEFLAADNEQYNLQVNALREELMQLRSLLLMHKDCQQRGKDDMLHALNRHVSGSSTATGMMPQSHHSFIQNPQHSQQHLQQHSQAGATAAAAAAAAAAALNAGALSFYNTSTSHRTSNNSQQHLQQSLLNLNMNNSTSSSNNNNTATNEQHLLKAEEFNIL